MSQLERITTNPNQMGGRACIRGMRMTVSMILGNLSAGRSIEEILDEYPLLEREDILATLEYASLRLSERELPVGA